VIRRHSLATASTVAEGGSNDLLNRLASDPAFAAIDRALLQAELDPSRYVGRAPAQVGEFLREYLDPLVERARPLAAVARQAELRV
jgi:adenylosuccinate lyase